MKSEKKRLEVHTILDELPIIVWKIDRNYRFTSATGAFSRLVRQKFGNSPDFTLFTFLGTSNPEDVAVACHRRAFRGQSCSYEYLYDDHYYRVDLKPYFAEGGDLVEEVMGMAVDVTEQKRMESALRRALTQQQALLENIPDMAWMKDTDSRFIAVNQAMLNGLNRTREEVIGQTDHAFFSAELADTYLASDRVVMETGEQLRVVERFVSQLGGESWVETMKRPLRGEDGQVTGTVGIARDVTDSVKAHEKEKELARTDSVTLLPNWRHFREVLNEAIEHSRTESLPLGILYIDLDHFKDVNDRWGHSAGDELLRKVGFVLRASIRQTDFAARLGGDEFAVLIPDASKENMQRIADRFRKAVESFRHDYSDCRIGATVGSSWFDVAPSSADEIVRAADQSMYERKAEGRRVESSEPAGALVAQFGAQRVRPSAVPPAIRVAR